MPRDAGLLATIDKLASAFPWTEKQFLPGCEEYNGSERSLVIEDTRLVAGFVVYNCMPGEGAIHNIAIRPRQQGQGLARELLVAAMRAVARQGATRCLLDVRESNTAARALYVSMGFHEDGLRKKYYRSGDGREDALLMSRQL